MLRSLVILYLVLATTQKASALQNAVSFDGTPPMIRYTAKDFGGNSQIWDVIQNEQGLMYVASFGGILEFDGEEWKVIAEPLIQSFDFNSNNRIYAGGYGAMGYLEATPSGMEYFSLLDKVPEEVEVVLIRNVHIIGQTIYFVAHEHIYTYDEKTETIAVISSDNRMYPSYEYEGRLIIMVDQMGLCEIKENDLSPLPQGDYWADKKVANFIEGTDNSLVTLSSESGAHKLTGKGPLAVDYFDPDYFRSNILFGARKVGKDNYGLCFLTGGFVLTDSLFNPVLVIDKKSGINNQVHNVYEDNEQNLWISTNDGLVYLNVSSPITHFGEVLGIEGSVSSTALFDGDWFTIGSSGVYYRNSSGDLDLLDPTHRTFKKVAQSEIGGITLINSQKNLFAAHTRKKGEIRGHRFYPLLENQNTYHAAGVIASEQEIIITNKENGKELEVFTLNNGNWKHAHSIKDDLLPNDLMNTVVYDEKHDCYWVVSTFNEAYRFSLNSANTKVNEVVMLGKELGLPEGLKQVFELDGDIFFGTPKGLFYYSHEENIFKKDQRFGDQFDEIGLYSLVKESESRYWYLSTNQELGLVVLDPQTQSATKHTDMFATVNAGASTAYLDLVSAGRLAIGTLDGMYLLQTQKNETYEFKHQPVIRSVSIIETDSSIYKGVYFDESKNQITSLPNEFNSLNFKYAAPFFKGAAEVLYRTKLGGFDKDWSSWTEKTQRDYTNIPQGNYIFSVQAKNVFGKLSQEVSYEFSVKPPWYLSSWAYVLYILLLVGLIRLVIFFNSRRLVAENVKLEQTIQERVREIEVQKGIIASSLKEKESLLKEIHHRVKNNLQIIASLLYLQSGKFEDEDFKRVLEEGQGRVRSMALIHQKLYENDDLKSIPFGEYLLELVGEIRASFGMHKVQLDITADDIFFDVDTAVPLGLIINELATNSFKYAFGVKDDETFAIRLIKQNEGYSLEVTDNGKGFSAPIDLLKTQSLGLRLVRMLSQQLEGKFEFDGKDGTSFNLKFVA